MKYWTQPGSCADFRTPIGKIFASRIQRDPLCGADNLDWRRLRAMIQNLLQSLPPHRHAALHQQLSLLDREIERNFTYPEELALARIADSQGLGGRSGKHAAATPT
jgi:hypothetical protein